MTRSSAMLRVALAALAILGTARLEAQKPPKTPRALPSGVAPFEVAKITSNTWYGRFGHANCAWLEIGDGVLVVDTGGSLEDAANLQKQIKETTGGKPVRWILLSHLHGHANNGLKAFLPTDATIFVNAHVAADVALAVQARDPKAKAPSVIGLSDGDTIVLSGRRFEFAAAPAAAHSVADLAMYDPSTGVAFIGDFVTPGHCPLMSDAAADPKGWSIALDRIRAFHAAVLVTTDGDASKLVENDLNATHAYIDRVLTIIAELKKKGMPEAAVAAELQIRKMGDTCPVQRDSANVVPLYRRAGADGVIGPPLAAAPPAKK